MHERYFPAAIHQDLAPGIETLVTPGGPPGPAAAALVRELAHAAAQAAAHAAHAAGNNTPAPRTLAGYGATPTSPTNSSVQPATANGGTPIRSEATGRLALQLLQQTAAPRVSETTSYFRELAGHHAAAAVSNRGSKHGRSHSGGSSSRSLHSTAANSPFHSPAVLSPSSRQRTRSQTAAARRSSDGGAGEATGQEQHAGLPVAPSSEAAPKPSSAQRHRYSASSDAAGAAAMTASPSFLAKLPKPRPSEPTSETPSLVAAATDAVASSPSSSAHSLALPVLPNPATLQSVFSPESSELASPLPPSPPPNPAASPPPPAAPPAPAGGLDSPTAPNAVGSTSSADIHLPSPPSSGSQSWSHQVHPSTLLMTDSIAEGSPTPSPPSLQPIRSVSSAAMQLLAGPGLLLNGLSIPLAEDVLLPAAAVGADAGVRRPYTAQELWAFVRQAVRSGAVRQLPASQRYR